MPSEAPWPEDAWGIKLGTRLTAIRKQEIYVKDRPDRIAELNRMGFIWDFYEEHWQRILDSLHVYKKLHGDLKVPYDFMVPSEAPWPEDAWGINLGTSVLSIRNQEIYVKGRPDRVAELNRMGFIWNINEEHWQRILESLHVYKELHGDVEVPYDSLWCRQRRRGPRTRGASNSASACPPSATRRITSRTGRTGSRS